MKPHALALASFAVLPFASSCSSANRDYQVAVPWTLNGMVPDPGLCQEQHITAGRFEVRSPSGKLIHEVEAPCDNTITLSDGNAYGGFLSKRWFDWDQEYDYTLTLIDGNGNAVSSPAQSSFYVSYEDADVFELSFLDYLNPSGTVAALSAEWSVGSTADVPSACTAARISKVRILVASGLDTELQDPVTVAEASCADGRFASPSKVLATGSYLFQYVALSDGGNVVESGQPIAVQVNGQDVALPREMFLSN